MEILVIIVCLVVLFPLILLIGGFILYLVPLAMFFLGIWLLQVSVVGGIVTIGASILLMRKVYEEEPKASVKKS